MVISFVELVLTIFELPSLENFAFIVCVNLFLNIYIILFEYLKPASSIKN